jgi:O-antigen/teichoic acid export membrane protein
MTNLKRVNPLIKSSIIYVLATLVGQGMFFLGIIVFTRLMNQTDYGNYSTYYAYVSIFTVLIGANLYYALNNAYIDKKDVIKQFRKTVLVLSVIIMISMILLALLVGTQILHKFTSFFIVMAGIHSYGFFVVNYRIYSANMENDYKKKQWLLILPNTLQFFFSLGLIVIFPYQAYEARIIGSALGVGTIALIAFIEIFRCEGNLVNIDYWRYALSISLPTIVMSISYMLMQQCDKVMITSIRGADETAIYSVIYYLGYAIIAVDQAIAPVRQAWIFNRLNENNTTEVSLIQKWYLIVMGILATGVIFVGPEIIKIIAPNNYWKFEYIVPFVLSACGMMLYRFFTEILLFYKKNISLSASVLICAVVNIGLNATLIPKFGAVAACYTTVISYLLLFILTWMLSVKCSGKLYLGKHFIKFIVWMVTMAILYLIIGEYLIIRYVALTAIWGGVFIYILKSKNEWKAIIWKK